MSTLLKIEALLSAREGLVKELQQEEQSVLVKRGRLEKLDALIATFDEPAPVRGTSSNGTSPTALPKGQSTMKVSSFEVVRRALLKMGDSFQTNIAFATYVESGKPGNLSREIFTTIVRKLAGGESPYLATSAPGRGKAAIYTKTERYIEWSKAFN